MLGREDCMPVYDIDTLPTRELFPGFTAEYVKAVRRPDLTAYRLG